MPACISESDLNSSQMLSASGSPQSQPSSRANANTMARSSRASPGGGHSGPHKLHPPLTGGDGAGRLGERRGGPPTLIGFDGSDPDASDIDASGTLVEAVNAAGGGSDTTVNGVTFVASDALLDQMRRKNAEPDTEQAATG